MHIWCTHPFVDVSSVLAVDIPAAGRSREFRGFEDNWPLSEICNEDVLPAFHFSPRKCSGHQTESGNAKFAMLRRQFVHLPSVGTWLRRLPDPIKVCPEPTLRSQKMWKLKAPSRQIRIPERPDPEPLEEFQGYILEGEVWATWTPCRILICWDRVVIKRKESEISYKENLHLWLNSSFGATMEGLNVVVTSDSQKVTIRGHSGMRFSACLVEALYDALSRLDGSISSKKMSFVHLNVYDLFNWQVGLLNNVARNLWSAGAFHVGIEIYDVEYAFGGKETGIDGSGITNCKPRACQKHSFRESLCLGVTSLTKEEVDDLLHEVAPDWSVQSYETLGPNCVTFCRVLSQRLGVEGVPAWVDSMAKSIKERRPVESLEIGHCANGHICKLQAQGVVAGLMEVILCAACGHIIAAGTPHWHCALCDTETCGDCGTRMARL